MATELDTLISAADYYNIAIDIATAKRTMAAAMTSVYSALNRVADITDVRPSVDLTATFWSMYQSADAQLSSNSLFTGAVAALQRHVTTYWTTGTNDTKGLVGWIKNNVLGVSALGSPTGLPDEFLALSKAAGYELKREASTGTGTTWDAYTVPTQHLAEITIAAEA